MDPVNRISEIIKDSKLKDEIKLYENTDGEFGAKTGFLVKVPYFDVRGVKTSVSIPLFQFYDRYTVWAGECNPFLKTLAVLFGKDLFTHDHYTVTNFFGKLIKFWDPFQENTIEH
jgi:hypothetical protein